MNSKDTVLLFDAGLKPQRFNEMLNALPKESQ
jgi:hypothetical protein